MTDSINSRIPSSPIPKLALSVAEATQAVPLCDKTILGLIRDGELKALRCGTRIVIPVAALQEWLARESGLTLDAPNGSEG